SEVPIWLNKIGQNAGNTNFTQTYNVSTSYLLKFNNNNSNITTSRNDVPVSRVNGFGIHWGKGGSININANVELGGFYQYKLYEVRKFEFWNPFYFGKFRVW